MAREGIYLWSLLLFLGMGALFKSVGLGLRTRCEGATNAALMIGRVVNAVESESNFRNCIFSGQ